MELIVAEKPSVARDLARVLGLKPSGQGAYEGNGRVITWCVGHLVELDEPEAYDARWKAWRLDTLPMLPSEFKLRPAKHAVEQLEHVVALLRDPRFNMVVNACDAGREGELIFRYLLQFARRNLPAKRLWISSLTDDAIRTGFAALKPAAQFDSLGDAARARSEADWLVGLNATRAVTLWHRRSGGDALFSIGRVQTPTLAMLVEREHEIRAFVPRDYCEVRATLTTLNGERFTARWTRGRQSRLATAKLSDAIVGRSTAHGAAADLVGPRVARLRSKTVREPPPQLFDLTSLQRTANRRFGFSAQRTLDLAQSLYERHKLLTYPRTDSRHLTSDVAKELPKLFAALGGVADYAPFASHLTAHPPRLNRRIVDDAKVHDHHAIIPTGKRADVGALDRDERRLFDLVARRFLGAFYPDAEFAVTEAWIRVGGSQPSPPEAVVAKHGDEVIAPLIATLPPPPDWYEARGRVRLQAGWQAVAGIDGADENRRRSRREGADEDAEPTAILPPLVEGQALDGRFESVAKKTTPPRRYTEATLLSAMESAGKDLSDDELRAAMKDSGLGTPATRAAIIETLIKRHYAAREQQAIVATATGVQLVETLPVATLASPELTGKWEARLERVARGVDTRAAFMADIAGYVREVVETVRRAAPPPVVDVDVHPPRKRRARPTSIAGPRKRRTANTHAPKAPAVAGRGKVGALACPLCRRGMLMTGKRAWGCDRWREGCGFVIPFVIAGKRVTAVQLRDLVTDGKTRKGTWLSTRGAPTPGRLVVELEPPHRGTAHFRPE